VKQNHHALYPKEFIEKASKDAPDGIHIILEGTMKDEVPLVALGYRYSWKTTLFFVRTKNAGTSSQLGEPYHMQYTDSFGNVCTCFVDHPQVISNLFASSNTIDPYFCLATTYIGIDVPDAFLLANCHKVINFAPNACEDKGHKISIQKFAGILVDQLIEQAKKLGGPPQRSLPEER
jgi:hypothetical protein